MVQMYMICPPRNLVSEANPLALVRVMLFVELKKRYKMIQVDIREGRHNLWMF